MQDTVSELPVELLNEPFSFWDTGDRPEMRVYRSDFLFIAHKDGSSVAIIGSREIRIEAPTDNYWSSTKLGRDCTSFSVINIYDTYGLEIALSFLQHLIHNKQEKNTNWLAVYLLGSLAMIDPEAEEIDRGESSVPHLCSVLSSRLSAFDLQQPRATEALIEAPSLPVELLAKITNSTRISKSLSSVVLMIRAQIEPNGGELAESTYPSTICIRNRFLCTWIDQELSFRESWNDIDTPLTERDCDVIHEWSLTIDHGIYRLEHLIGDEVEDDECDGYTSVHSMNMYEAIYNSRDCNGRSIVISRLDKMSKRFSRVTGDNVSEVCSWIVQLSHDSEDGAAKVMVGYDELRDELQRLIRSHIAKTEREIEDEKQYR